MSEIAVGYVSIVPKFGGGFKDAIANSVGGAGAAGGRTFGTGFRDTFLGVLAADVMKSAISGIAGTVRAAFGGGFDRLMNIEQAQIKLRTLGIDVEGAMASVNDAVDGTRFAISDAADMAAILGASGMEAGADMTRWLTVTADTAQFLGSNFTDAQDIVARIAQTGRVTGMELNRLPLAAAALADHLGISQEEVRRLASQGQISAEDFAAAIEGKIGGAAKDAGGSFLSMRDNLRTALNASMANLLQPFTKALMPLMGAGLELVKGFRDNVAKPLGESLTEWLVPAAERAAERLLALPETFANIRATVNGHMEAMREGVDSVGDGFGALSGIGAQLREALGSVFSGLGEAVEGFIDGFGGIDPLIESVIGLLPLVTGPLGILSAALRDVFGDGSVDMRAFGELVGTTLRPVIDTVVDLAGVLVDALAQGLATIIPIALEVGQAIAPLVLQLIQELAPIIGQLASELVPPLVGILTELAPIISDAVTAIAPLISSLISALAPALSTIISAIAGLVELLAPVLVPVLELLASVLVGAVQGAIQGVTLFINGLRDVIDGIVQFVTAIFNGDWRGAWEALKQIVWGVIQAVAGAIWTWLNVTILGAIRGGIARLLTMWKGGWKSILDFFKNFGSNVSGFASNIMSNVANFFRTGITNARATVTNGLTAIRNFFTSALNAVRNAVSTVINAVANFFRTGLNNIRSAVSGGLNSVRTLFTNAMNGIRTAVSNGVTNVLRFFRELPGRILSALGNVGNMLKGAGRSLLGGFVTGIQDGFNRAKNAVSNGLSGIRRFFPFSPAKEGPFSGSGYTLQSGRALMSDFAKGVAQESDAANRILADALTVTPNLNGATGQAAGGAASKLGGGATIAGPLVHVANMTVRSDDDIRRVSQNLQRSIDDALRAKGAAMVGG